MDKSNKTGNYDREKKENKTVVKFGGGGGGIGAVILLGGVLATAALASAFAARRKGRSSGGNDRRSFHRNPPPENDKLSEQDEGDNDALSLDVKVNGVSDDGFVIVDEDFPQLPLESENKIHEDEQTEGDVSDDYSKEMENQEQVCIEEEPKQEVDKDFDEERENELKENMEVKFEGKEVKWFCNGDEELMSENKCLQSVVNEDGNERRESELHTQIVEIVDEERENGLKGDMEVKLEREEVEGFCSGEAELMSEKKCLESVVSDNGNEERESGLHTEIVDEERESGDEERENELKEDMQVKLERKEEVEVFCSGEAELISEKKCLQSVVIEDEIERGSGLHTQIVEIIQKDEQTWNEEKLVEKQEKCEEKQRNETRDKIEEKEDEENREENGCILHQIPNGIADEEQAEFDAKKNVEKEVDVSPEATNQGLDDAKSDTNSETREEEEKVEIVEESSLESGDSSSVSYSEAVWPSESEKSKINTKDETFIDKYYMGEMETKNDCRTNSGRRRVATAALLLLSSLSCSWFFGLSSVNLCLVVFLTMLLSEIRGY